MNYTIDDLTKVFGEDFKKYIEKEGIRSSNDLTVKLESLKSEFKRLVKNAEILDFSKLTGFSSVLGEFIKFLVILRLSQIIKKSKVIQNYFNNSKTRWTILFGDDNSNGYVGQAHNLIGIDFYICPMLEFFVNNIEDPETKQQLKKIQDKNTILRKKRCGNLVGNFDVEKTLTKIKDGCKAYNAKIKAGVKTDIEAYFDKSISPHIVSSDASTPPPILNFRSTGKNDVFKVVDHEVGHFINFIYAYNRTKSKLEFIIPKLNEYARSFQSHIDTLNHLFPTLTPSVQTIIQNVCTALIKNFSKTDDPSDSIVDYYDYLKQSERLIDALIKKLKKLKIKVPAGSPSEYAGLNFGEFFAETRTNSKAKIYSELKKRFNLSINNDESFQKLRDIVDGKSSTFSNDLDVKEATRFLNELTSIKYAWGLAYRLLDFDGKFNQSIEKYTVSEKFKSKTDRTLSDKKQDYDKVFESFIEIVQELNNSKNTDESSKKKLLSWGHKNKKFLKVSGYEGDYVKIFN